MSRSVYISIALGYDDFLAYYQGVVNTVSARDWQGRVIHFPASILRQFLTHTGIHGSFRIDFDDNNRFIGIARVED